MSLPLKITCRLVLTIGLLIALSLYVPQYIAITGEAAGFIIIGALLAVLNIVARPVIRLLAIPLSFFSGFLATLLTNCLILLLTVRIANQFDPSIVTIMLRGGWVGFLLLALIIGLFNWIFRLAVDH